MKIDAMFQLNKYKQSLKLGTGFTLIKFSGENWYMMTLSKQWDYEKLHFCKRVTETLI